MQLLILFTLFLSTNTGFGFERVKHTTQPVKIKRAAEWGAEYLDRFSLAERLPETSAREVTDMAYYQTYLARLQFGQAYSLLTKREKGILYASYQTLIQRLLGSPKISEKELNIYMTTHIQTIDFKTSSIGQKLSESRQSYYRTVNLQGLEPDESIGH